MKRLNEARKALAAAGWPARSWQQDGLLVEDEAQPRRNRDGQIPPHAKEMAMQRLKSAIGEAEAAIKASCDYDIEFSVKPFFDKSVADVLWRFSGSDLDSGCRVASEAVALEATRASRDGPGGAPPKRCAPAARRVAAAEAAQRVAEAAVATAVAAVESARAGLDAALSRADDAAERPMCAAAAATEEAYEVMCDEARRGSKIRAEE